LGNWHCKCQNWEILFFYIFHILMQGHTFITQQLTLLSST
jgi:hypothetical protein